MKTRALVEDYTALAQQFAASPSPKVVEQAIKRVGKYDAEGKSLFNSSAPSRLTNDKLERVAKKIVESLGDSVPAPMRDSFIKATFPRLIPGVQLANKNRDVLVASRTAVEVMNEATTSAQQKARSIEDAALSKAASIISTAEDGANTIGDNANLKAADIIRRAEAQADEAVQKRMDSGLAMLNEASAKIKTSLDAMLSMLESAQAAVGVAQGDLASVKQEHEAFMAEAAQSEAEMVATISDWNTVDAHIKKRFASLPENVDFTSGGACLYTVSRARLESVPCVLSTLASGFFKEYQKPAEGEEDEPVPVKNISPDELGILCRFIEFKQLPKLGAHNAEDLLALADRFCIAEMKSQIEGYLTGIASRTAVDSTIFSDSESSMVAASTHTFRTRTVVGSLGALAMKAIASEEKVAVAITHEIIAESVYMGKYMFPHENSPVVGWCNFSREESQNAFDVGWLIIEQRLQRAGYKSACLRVGGNGEAYCNEAFGFILQLEGKLLGVVEAAQLVRFA